MGLREPISVRVHPLHLHDDFLPGRVVGDVVDPLLLLWHFLHTLHQFLEHCSLPEKQHSAGH